METKVWRISEVNSAVRQVIEGGFASFWLEGEIGTITIHRSGHVYLVLKDSKTQIRAVFWRGATKAKKLGLKTGSKILAFGRLTVYETRGEYQFKIMEVRLAGVGELQKRFEELKEKLKNEGLFEDSRKQPTPQLPQTIGVVTSPTGAAIRDFINIINRRFPNMNIKIYPAPVQGQDAEKKLIEGIKFFNKKYPVDIVVIMRGGGSIEDLWSFNDETLARTISNSSIPIISAVGHETDFTISDFVADLRVPTPSAAAELVISCQDEIENSLDNLKRRLKSIVELTYEKLKRRLEGASNSYVLQDPLRMVYEKQQLIDEFQMRMKHIAKFKFEKTKNKFEYINSKLDSLNPKNVLKRGYSILRKKNTGEIITNGNVSEGTLVNALLMEGELNLVVRDE